MPAYDVACIARKKASNKKMNRLVGRVAKDLKKRGGVVRKVAHYGMRPLAYPIRRKSQKHEVGRYFRIFVQASPQALQETLQTLRVDEDVIRFKPFKMHPNEMLDLREKIPFTHKAKISEAHYDALKRSTNIDYYVARTLLLQGKITREELETLGTHEVKFEPYFRSREEEIKDWVFEGYAVDLEKAGVTQAFTGGKDVMAVDFDELSDLTDEQDMEIKHKERMDKAAAKSKLVEQSPEFAYLELSDSEQEKNAV